MSAAFLDDDFTVTATTANRQVAVALDALLITDRSDTVPVADSLCTRRKREQGGTCRRDRDGKDISSSHLWPHICFPARNERKEDEAVP